MQRAGEGPFGDRFAQAPVVGRPAIYLVAACTVLALGLNWPVMTWGLETIPPLWLTTVRLLGAAVVVALVLALRGRLRPPPRHDYPVVATVAVVRLALVYSLVMSALLLVPPGRSSVLAHTGALWAVPIGIWALREHPSRATFAGLSIGVVGILLLMEPWTLEARPGAGLGYLMLLGAALATAVATVHVRGHRWTAPPLALMPWQLLLAGLITLPVALVAHGLPRVDWTPQAIAVVAYQVFLATALGLWGTLTLGRSLPAVSSGMLFMAVPAIGLLSSMLLVDEVVTRAAAVGILLVFAGLALNIASDRGTRVEAKTAAATAADVGV